MASEEIEPGVASPDDSLLPVATSLPDQEHADQSPLPSQSDEGPDDWSYQELFRSIGSMLDGDTTGALCIVEVDDGFVIRNQRTTQAKIEVAVSHLQRSELVSYAQELRRTRPGSQLRYHPGIWSNFQVTFQDFLRALGHELDTIGARHVVIDELSDGLFLMGELAEHEGAPARAWRLALGTSEIEEILDEAVRRRTDMGDAKPWEFSRVKRDERGTAVPPQPDATWSELHMTGSYQESLRTIGRMLDQLGAAQVCLMEVPGGIAARYRRLPDGTLTWTRFADNEIPADGPLNRQKAGLFHRPIPQEPGPYSDLFRALGDLFRRLGAYDILINEQEDGLTVTYQFRDPKLQLKPRRTRLFLSRKEQQDLVQQARAQRQPDTSWRTRVPRR